MSDDVPQPVSRTVRGRFAKGNPGGPGRPRGAVSTAAAALDRAAVAAQLDLMQVVLEQARAGNLEATKMLWARIWPMRRDRPVALNLPPIESAKDVLPAKAAITQAVLAGDITANEAERAPRWGRQMTRRFSHRFTVFDGFPGEEKARKSGLFARCRNEPFKTVKTVGAR
jgi:hypothetical protein